MSACVEKAIKILKIDASSIGLAESMKCEIHYRAFFLFLKKSHIAARDSEHNTQSSLFIAFN